MFFKLIKEHLLVIELYIEEHHFPFVRTTYCLHSFPKLWNSYLFISLRYVYFGQFEVIIVLYIRYTSENGRDLVQGDTKKWELLKTPTKIEEIQEKKFIDRNWTIKTCLLRDSNTNYECLKITSCRWLLPPRMHSFTATTHFKSSRSFMSPWKNVKECLRGGRRHLQDVLFKHW